MSREEEKKKYRREYYLKNKDKILTYSRERHKRNREEFSERSKMWYWNNQDKVKAYRLRNAERIKKYRESRKEHAKEIYKKYMEKPGTKERIREYRKLYQLKHKTEFVNAYGGKCVCCGETELAFLTAEHIFKDGGEHRKMLGGGGCYVYLDIKRQGYPKDKYTVLCMNCNFAEKNGYPCPHKSKAQ